MSKCQTGCGFFASKNSSYCRPCHDLKESNNYSDEQIRQYNARLEQEKKERALAAAVKHTAHQQRIGDRKRHWREWQSNRTNGGPDTGLIWTFTHRVPVYYQGDDWEIDLNTDCGHLTFIGGEEPDIKFPHFDVNVNGVVAGVGALLNLTQTEWEKVEVKSIQGIKLTASDLVLKEANGESDSDSDSDSDS